MLRYPEPKSEFGNYACLLHMYFSRNPTNQLIVLQFYFKYFSVYQIYMCYFHKFTDYCIKQN